MFIGAVEETAKGRLNAHDVEVIPTHFVDPGARRISSRVECRQSDAVSRQTIKAAIAIAQFEIVGIRLRRSNVRAPDCIKALLLRHVQLVQQERVHGTKHHRVCADAQGQRHNGNGSKAGRFAQLA